MTAAGLGYLLGLQPFPLQHIVEIGIAAKIKLVGPLQFDTAVLEEPGEHAMDYSGPHLGLYIITNNGKPALKTRLPVLLRPIKTGMQLTKPQPAASTCSIYHLVASSLPTGR